MTSEMRNIKFETGGTPRCRAFTIMEMVTSLIILALICSSVLVVINRCIASAADSALRMEAFEIARENMEKLLVSDSVSRDVKYGTSDKFPEIKWQTTVEAFYEPITTRMWIKGTCSAEYTDMAGEIQTIELTHWLTDVTKQQMLEILKEQQTEKTELASVFVGSLEEAAEYAGVDVETIEQWIDNGMLTTEDGSIAKTYLDTFIEYDGSPPAEVISELPSLEELADSLAEQAESGEQETPAAENQPDEIDPVTGLTYGELEQMDPWEIFQLLLEKYPLEH
jgi:hypothetical protein